MIPGNRRRTGAASVRIDNVSKSFGAANTVLDGVTLDLKPGRVTSVLGESGCGKTTLLRIVAGLDQPSAGRILIDGEDVTDAPPTRRDVAMVFQNYGLYPAKTVLKNIEFPLKMAGVGKTQRRQRAAATAALLHVEHLLHRLPSQLSGGQRQRVGICRALVRDPRIVLMDEPLSHLDAQLRVEMRSEIMALQRRVGSTMLYVTHEQVEAMTMSDSLALMKDGRIEQAGGPEEVFTAPRTTYAASFLGNMNIIEVEIDEGALLSDGLRIGHLADNVDLGANQKVHIGIRPERLSLGPPQAGSPSWEATTAGIELTGLVLGSELLGSDRMVRVAVGPHTVRARIDSTVVLPERVVLTASPHSIHVFDASTGIRLTT
jgi:ABC-type sugar transport system ATPase subunit